MAKTSKKKKTAVVQNTIQRVLSKMVAAKDKKQMPDFSAGDTVTVYVKVKEGEKERVQAYRGVVLKVQGSGYSKTFTVRKISSGIGVERAFPLYSPVVDRVEVISHGKVRRSKLYYLRDLSGRKARLTSELVTEGEAAAPGETAETQPAAQ